MPSFMVYVCDQCGTQLVPVPPATTYDRHEAGWYEGTVVGGRMRLLESWVACSGACAPGAMKAAFERIVKAELHASVGLGPESST